MGVSAREMQNKVFISYKNSDKGLPTVDSIMAYELYSALSKAGIPCFCAGKTLQEVGADKYKEQIDLELDSCIIMVVVGTSLDNINSRWVKYEWDGFYLDILNGYKNGKVFTYTDGINPHILPRALRSVQAFDKKKDSLVSIVSFVENAIQDIEIKTHNTQTAMPSDVDLEMDNYSFDTYEFSSQFLHKEIISLGKSSSEVVKTELIKLSSLYESITTVKRYRVNENASDLSQRIYSIIIEGCKNKKNANLLKIKSPLGSFKDRLLQCIYLLLEKEEKDILPIYINLEKYEHYQMKYGINSFRQLEQVINSHFEYINKIINREKNRVPLIILDGIRNFSNGQDSFYSIIKENTSKLRCNTVVSLDTEFTNNTNHKFSVHPLVGTDFEYFIRITSMSTYNKKGSIAFIEKCLNIFNISIPYENVDAITIYKRLIKLNVIKLDAYWLVVLLTEMLGNILNEDITIADLYEAICRKNLDTASIASAAEMAYEYEYGTVDFRTSNYFLDEKWQVIQKHRSVLDYLIAKYYILKLEELDVNNTESAKKRLRFFNMILPKAVTIFVSPMINKIDAYENKVLTIANNFYDQMSVFEKNQLIYWMGRLKNKTGIEESTLLLKKYKETQLNRYLEKTVAGLDSKKNAFLLRTICVSLIVIGDKEAANEYFNLLLMDKYTNEVNRAFHLTYYGDKPYIPNKTLLDFDDDIKRGTNTFEILCSSVQNKIDSRRFNYIVILEVFTLCSLLQARIEGKCSGEESIETQKYALFTQKYLKWICNQRRLSEFERIKNYFLWMQEELKKYYVEKVKYSRVDVYNEYSAANKTLRTGWVKRNIPSPENIVEHMYNCWLIAALYLPEKTDYEGYSKNKILSMLLIHDIAETKTGDVARPEKQLHQKYYDENENSVMHSLLFSGTYPRSQGLVDWFESWDNWYYNKDINYKIAKDIDNIQAIYKFCEYYLKYREAFTEEDALDWYSGIYDIKTEEGQRIAEILITQNQKFAEINQKFDIQNDSYY